MFSTRDWRALAGAVLLFLIGTVRGAAPTVDFLFPAGGQRGTTLTITATGKFDAWPVQAWADTPVIHVNAGKNKGTLTVQIDATAPIGPHLIRLYSDDGASALRCLVVGDRPETMEIEPNDEPATAQLITSLPATINGQLEKSGDVDCYAVKLEAGACLVASVQGRRLGSPIDPMLHVIDAEGTECAFAHDGLGLDPLLAFRADKAGRYIVRVSAFANPPAADVKLAGGAGDIYRLSITTGPFAHFSLPTGVRRSEKSAVRLLGWNLPLSEDARQLSIDATQLTGTESYLNVSAQTGDGWLRVPLSDGPECLDQDVCKDNSILPVPVNISGIIESPGMERKFRLAGKKGEALRFTVRAGAINSPLDGVLRIEDTEGKIVVRANGAGGPTDATLDWTVPADGKYFVVLSDLFHKGGPDYVYRLEIKHPTPTVEAVVDNHAYRLFPGTTASVKIKVARKDGYAGGLVAVATSLPAGVTSTSAEVPVKGGELTLTLSAAGDAKPFNGNVRFMILSTEAQRPQVFPAIYTLRSEKDVTQEFVEQTDMAWLTVSPMPPATAPTTEPAQ